MRAQPRLIRFDPSSHSRHGLDGVIPKPRVFTGGARDLARSLVGDIVDPWSHGGHLNFVTVHNSTIRSFFLEGPSGRLEALLNAGSPEATHAALVCHPHPLFGGTLHNKVVYHTMKALNSFGFPVLRFNFRGTGLSQGEHDYGAGEVDDVRAALAWLEADYRLPLILAGFSFGAAVGLRAACPDDRVKAVISLGTPVATSAAESEVPRAYNLDFLHDCRKPKLFVSGSNDRFGPRAKLEAVVAAAAEPKTLIIIEGADHFFEGKLHELRQTIEEWIREAIVSFFPDPGRRSVRQDL